MVKASLMFPCYCSIPSPFFFIIEARGRDISEARPIGRPVVENPAAAEGVILPSFADQALGAEADSPMDGSSADLPRDARSQPLRPSLTDGLLRQHETESPPTSHRFQCVSQLCTATVDGTGAVCGGTLKPAQYPSLELEVDCIHFSAADAQR